MLPLSPEAIEAVRSLISQHFSALSIRLGVIADPEESLLADLISGGILSESSVNEVDLLNDSYFVGLLQEKLVKEGRDPRSLTMEDLKPLISKYQLGPAQQERLLRSKLWTSEKVKDLGNMASTRILTSIRDMESTLLSEVSDHIAAQEARQASARELAGSLRDLTEDLTRDWLRVSVSEIHDIREHGVSDSLKAMFGKDARVAKVPSPGACKHCLKAYTIDGQRPRIFKLSELEANGTNLGRKAADRKATVGPLHPFCQCYLVGVPDGFDFDDSGELVPMEKN